MDSLFSNVGRTLAVQVSKGLMTLEQLDQPPPGHLYVEDCRAASGNPCDWTDPKQKVPYYNAEGDAYWTYPRPPMEYPPAKPYRNLAREWIAANPKDWERLNGRQPVSVEVTSPKDLPSMATGITPAQRQDLPITLDEEEAATPSVPRQPVEASSQRQTLEPIDDEADRSSPLFW